MSPVKPLFRTDNTLIESGGIGNAPWKRFKASINICTDEFPTTLAEPSKPLNKLLPRFTKLRRGRFHNHRGIFPWILFFEMSICSNLKKVFKMFGNTLRPQREKSRTSTFIVTLEDELILVASRLFPERSSLNNDLRVKKSLTSIG
ncbi:unnamed protein product [Brassica oleracea]